MPCLILSLSYIAKITTKKASQDMPVYELHHIRKGKRGARRKPDLSNTCCRCHTTGTGFGWHRHVLRHKLGATQASKKWSLN